MAWSRGVLSGYKPKAWLSSVCTVDKCLWSVLLLVPWSLGELDESLSAQEGLFLAKVPLMVA